MSSTVYPYGKNIRPFEHFMSTLVKCDEVAIEYYEALLKKHQLEHEYLTSPVMLMTLLEKELGEENNWQAWFEGRGLNEEDSIAARRMRDILMRAFGELRGLRLDRNADAGFTTRFA